MSLLNSGTHYLLQITILNTHSPVLSRILSVPSRSTFSDLHLAISASFGWKLPTQTPPTWSFAVVAGDPLLSRYPRESLRKLLRLYVGADSPEAWDARIVDMRGVFERFSYRSRDLLYDPSIFGGIPASIAAIVGPLLAVKIIGRASQQSNTLPITCLGGQGRLDPSLWNLGDDNEIFNEELSQWGNWDPDFPKVNARLRFLQQETRAGVQGENHMLLRDGQPGFLNADIDDEDLNI